MTRQDEELFKASSLCKICGECLNSDKVRDHCHICGRFRGSTHSSCNLNYRVSKTLIVIFHNLKKYDGHIIMQQLGESLKHTEIDVSCIARTMEDYISFTVSHENYPKWSIKFVDSYQFLQSSLDKLASHLRDSMKDRFAILSNRYPDTRKLQLLMKKGFLPYEFLDSEAKLEMTRLPDIQNFYSSLSNKTITEDEYNHAKDVWEVFSIETMKDYLELYCQTDTLLLADIFENFREFTIKNYGELDPCNYITLPSLGYDICLSMKNTDVDLLTQEEMYEFFEAGVRGGNATAFCRYAAANNKLMKNYNPNEPTNYIIYFDANNLYGWAMRQPLPSCNFRWLTREEANHLDVSAIEDEAEIGYVLDVDLMYPHECHESHDDYPLAPENLTITSDMLSPYCKVLLQQLGIKHTNTQKLVSTLAEKRNYIVHYRNLKLYLELGMKLLKINRGIAFVQTPWMRPYIDFNTDKRSRSTDNFDKNMFKFLNNSVFGKTMENVRKYQDVKMATDEKTLRKLVVKPQYKSAHILHENLVAVNMLRSTVRLCKPMHTGFTILELSKLLMYNFHYKFMKKIYGNKIKVLYTDTDSLCYQIFTEDIYIDMKNCIKNGMFVTSNYPNDHFLHDNSKKMKLGYFKDETAGTPIEEFVGVRSKMYSFKYGTSATMRAKGLPKSVIAQNLNHEKFRSVLLREEPQTKHVISYIKSMNHQLMTFESEKKGIIPYDDKRFLLDSVHSLAYGNKRLNSHTCLSNLNSS